MIPALFHIDTYKLFHAEQYPIGTEYVYSNFTPRSNKHLNIPLKYKDDLIVWVGMQSFMKEFNKCWNETFFSRDIDEVEAEFMNHIEPFLNGRKYDFSKFRKLHELGFIPIDIRSLPEGSLVPIGVPCFTVVNTLPGFGWITNFLEDWFSAELWKPCTTATVARAYRKIVSEYAKKTGAPFESLDYQCHDFSVRGMSGINDSARSGIGHLMYFKGTDNLPAINYIKQYYNSDFKEYSSVPATEHSVMCAGGKETELETFRRLLKIYPEGIVSIVSDTWDFWKVIIEYTQELRKEIVGRDGKVVFRPDSGDPVKIICGDPDAEPDTPEFLGAVECLWVIFGGSVNKQGYKVLNPKVGLIYGDSITHERADQILSRLMEKGFSSENIVFGVGSVSYNFHTRDTLGFAMKATYVVINGKGYDIFKQPKTDDGTKNSAKGLLKVVEGTGRFVLVTPEDPRHDQLFKTYLDGNILYDNSFDLVKLNNTVAEINAHVLEKV